MEVAWEWYLITTCFACRHASTGDRRASCGSSHLNQFDVDNEDGQRGEDWGCLRMKPGIRSG